ncbi:MAG: bifunctional anthranilate synthase component I family protein/class IV aminotransferase, partial [bacterium]
ASIHPGGPGGSEGPCDPLESWTLDVSPEDFAARVSAIRRAIEAGETYQVNLTARMRALSRGAHAAGRPGGQPEGFDFDGSAACRRLYDRLRRSQGDGYHALLELDHQTVVSASPELFFQIRGREVTVRPMKGTRPRGRWLEEDEALARELRDSEKEQAENRMIVDLLRNDLGRVAAIGSVRVPRVFDVERYRTVLQMTSTVTGTLPRGAGFVDVLRALFPSGSVTGAPKIRTMKLIAELESSPREVYCGAIGYVEGGSGDAVFNVPIRTLRIDRRARTAVYGTGSGITWGSTAAEEYDEIRAKARILTERWPEFDLLETLRLEGGRYRRLERHLARMRDSATYFGRPFPEVALREALAEVARRGADQNASVGAGGPREPAREPGTERARASSPPAAETRAGDPADAYAEAYKVRTTLSEAGEVGVTVEPLDPAALEGTSAGRASASAEAASGRRPGADDSGQVALAEAPVDSGDRFLFHKTTHRVVYDGHRAARPDVLDVLLWNERGEITEFTRGNVVLEIDGRRLTPTRSSGLLAGCFRAELLEEGMVEEAPVMTGDLARARKIWLVNSVRGWVPVTFPGREPEDPS